MALMRLPLNATCFFLVVPRIIEMRSHVDICRHEGGDFALSSVVLLRLCQYYYVGFIRHHVLVFLIVVVVYSTVALFSRHSHAAACFCLRFTE